MEFMKKIFYTSIASLLFCACSNEVEQIESAKKGVELTMSATIGKSAETRTTYTRETVGMTVDWEAEEAITLISFDDSGITAIDNFSSSGDAGREKAEFTGTWNGNAGDKVICLYPALSTTAGASMYSATVRDASIAFTYPAHSPFRKLATLKNWDVMIGDVNISGSDASVSLNRQIALLEFYFTGGFYDSPDLFYIEQIGVSAASGSSPALFVKQGSIATTKSTYTGDITPSSFQEPYYLPLDVQITNSGTYFHPVVANGTLNEGDVIHFNCYHKEKWGWAGTSERYENSTSKTLAAPFTITPGNVYKFPEVNVGI